MKLPLVRPSCEYDMCKWLKPPPGLIPSGCIMSVWPIVIGNTKPAALSNRWMANDACLGRGDGDEHTKAKVEKARAAIDRRIN